jgi:hypothetical protein
VFDVAVAGTLLAACGLAKPQAAIEPNSRYTDIKNAVGQAGHDDSQFPHAD